MPLVPFDALVSQKMESASFRKALLMESIEVMFNGEMELGKSLFKDFIKSTIGFVALGRRTGIPSKSLIRMFGPDGNPNASNLFKVIDVLRADTGVALHFSRDDFAA